MKFDFFICHATEDKESFVRPLVIQLKSRGYKVWYDEFSLKIGDDLREKIDNGLSNSRKGIIVLSHHFFKKEWTKRELAGLTAKETSGELVILPIWHNITHDDIMKYSPPLAGKYAVKSSDGLKNVVNKIIDSITGGDNKISEIFDTDQIKNKKIYNKHKELIIKGPSPFGKGIIYNLLDKEDGRRFLEIGLVELVKKHRGRKIYVLIADVDELTLINKTFGVTVGDKVLDSIFNIIYSETKKYKHITGRCGEDTFFSILHNIGSGKIKNVPTQIIHNINRNNWNTIAKNLRVSCSFGYAQMSSEEDIRDSIIRAYQGVLEAKSAGEKFKAGPSYLSKTDIFSYAGGFGWS